MHDGARYKTVVAHEALLSLPQNRVGLRQASKLAEDRRLAFDCTLANVKLLRRLSSQSVSILEDK